MKKGREILEESWIKWNKKKKLRIVKKIGQKVNFRFYWGRNQIKEEINTIDNEEIM